MNKSSCTVANNQSCKCTTRFAVLLILASLILLFLWRSGCLPEKETLLAWIDATRSFLERQPAALILSLAILPGLGAPVSPLLILFGIVLGPLYGLPAACIIGVAAQSVCTAWTYFLASGPLRGFLQKTLLRNRTLPELSSGNAAKICFMIRIAPGFPYALQNVVLGVLKMRFSTYLLVSVPIQSIYTVGFISTGGAFFEGNTGQALTALLLLLAALFALRIIRKRNKNHDG
ncbi:MAG: TVP38/TMEM64 family protein [Coraliomargaritaceae bacterium]